jgi:uncharacterized protein YsxB (DUF464 family)
MTRALIYDSGSRKDRIVSISSIGHSMPEVCVAVSALIQTVVGILVSLAKCNPDYVGVAAGYDEGCIALDMICKGKASEKDNDFINSLMVFLRYGLESIKTQYPEDLALEVIDGKLPIYNKEGCTNHIDAWRTDNMIDLQLLRPFEFIRG